MSLNQVSTCVCELVSVRASVCEYQWWKGHSFWELKLIAHVAGDAMTGCQIQDNFYHF